MMRITIDFDDIQKAMEDTSRDAFDYFLDTMTGDVKILSGDIMRKAHSILYESLDEDMADYDGVEFDEEIDMADWIEDEVELALDIFLYGGDRYVRIPERDSGSGYAAMKDFAGEIENEKLKNALLGVLEGKGAFRKFKNALESHPRERKQWYKFNADRTKKEINLWLQSLGLSGQDGRK